MEKYTGCIFKYCDRCGVFLTKKNNKCGYDLCDECNDWLEKYVVEEDKEEK